MWVKLARPEWDRSCLDCIRFAHDERGRKKVNPRTKQAYPNNGPTPCYACAKVPTVVHDADGKAIEKTPSNVKRLRLHAVEMTPRILQAWHHYRECRAVGQFPDDPIVRENAALFRDVEDELQNDRAAKREQTVFDALMVIANRR